MSRTRAVGTVLCSVLFCRRRRLGPRRRRMRLQRATSSPRRRRRGTSRRRFSSAPSSCTTARIIYLRVDRAQQGVEGETGDSEANKQKAEFWMGKALYNMKFYSASLSYFDRIVQKGPSHAYYNATLKWLASLSRQLPDSTGILEKIGSTSAPSSISPRSRRCATSSTSCSASTTTRRATSRRRSRCSAPSRPSSEFYVQAKLFEGATHVREYQAKPAVDAFKEVLEGLGREQRPQGEAVRGSRQPLAGAHVLLDRASSTWPRSTSTASRRSRTTGPTASSRRRGPTSCSSRRATRRRSATSTRCRRRSSRTTSSRSRSAEALTVKATIYFYNCLYDRAEEAINEFNAVYPRLVGELKKLLTGTADNARALRPRGQDPQRHVGPARADRARRARRPRRLRRLVKRFQYVEELDRELEQHEKAEAGLEVDQHRPGGLRRPDAAAVAGRQRGR